MLSHRQGLQETLQGIRKRKKRAKLPPIPVSKFFICLGVVRALIGPAIISGQCLIDGVTPCVKLPWARQSVPAFLSHSSPHKNLQREGALAICTTVAKIISTITAHLVDIDKTLITTHHCSSSLVPIFRPSLNFHPSSDSRLLGSLLVSYFFFF